MKRYLILTALVLCPFTGLSQNPCPAFNPGVSLGTVKQSALTEISGIAASRRFANVLWAHNDSGDSARIFALRTDGTHWGIFSVTGASAVDWEDMAIGPGPVAGQDYLFLSDTGNNALNRTVVTVYRIAEPPLDTYQLPVQTSVSGVAAFPMQYPSGARYDSETLLVDPLTGDMLIVTRDRSHTGTTYVFLNPAPQQPGVLVTLQLVATLSSVEIVGGDVSRAGDLVILRPNSSTQGMFWRRTPGTDLESVFTSSPCVVPFVLEPQGEAVSFTPDATGYYSISEGSSQPVYFYGPPALPSAPGSPSATALSSTQIRLSWTDNANNEVGYRIERSGDNVTFVQIAQPAANSNTYTDSGLQPSTTYWYRITAYNAAGWSTAGPVNATTSAVTVAKPSAPSNLTATADLKSQITIRWTDNASNESGFRIDRSTDGFFFSQITTVGPNTTSFKNTGLNSNRRYYYRVRAYNSAGNSSYSNTASARTPSS